MDRDEDVDDLCQCCGRRPGRRSGPSFLKKYVCDQCLQDPSPTFLGCRHGIEIRICEICGEQFERPVIPKDLTGLDREIALSIQECPDCAKVTERIIAEDLQMERLRTAELAMWLDKHEEERLKTQDKRWIRTYDAFWHELEDRHKTIEEIIEEFGIVADR